MNYEECLEYVHSIPKFRRPLGNEKLSRLLDKLGNPQKKLRFIHITGTNGKGSTAAMTAEILKRSGFITGLFTSPYIEIFNERIRVNGENIPDNLLAATITEVRRVMEQSGAYVSEFAFITAAAFLYFRESECDFVVLEAGMGGRLDATNVIDKSEVSVICKIALDHTQYLGDTAEEIALEKCGIIRDGGSVAVYPNDTAVSDIIEQYAKSRNAELSFADLNAADGYELSLKGAYQRANAAVVLEIIKILRKKGFAIPEQAVKEGLANTVWQARFEFVADDIIIDGAHNPDGIRALKESLLALNRKIILVMAMMEDKAYEECIREIAPMAERVYAAELDMPRCLDADKIAAAVHAMDVECIVIRNVRGALKEAASNADGCAVCVCGSLYLAGEARKFLKKNKK